MTLPPVPGFGILWGELNNAQRQEVMDDIASDGAQMLIDMIDMLEEGLGLPSQTPAERLDRYRVITPQEWQELHDSYPLDGYDRMQSDWHALLTRDQQRNRAAKAGQLSGPAVY